MTFNIPRRMMAVLAATLGVLLQPLRVSAAALDAPPAPAAVVENLLQRDLTSDPRREVLMITVEYRPGGASLPHRHDAQVFVYVLEGEITMQVTGKAPVTLRPGDTFYEGITDVHRVSANASPTAPAKMLVFMIKQKSKPVSRGVTEPTS